MTPVIQKPIVTTHLGRQVVLGRKSVSPRIVGPRRLLARQHLESLPPPPRKVDWIKAAEDQCGGDFGQMLNDQLGCCTIADGPGHFTQIWTANNGKMVTPADSAILRGYELVDGYIEGRPDTDNGGVETEVLAAWEQGIVDPKTGELLFEKLEGWLPVSLSNPDHVRKAIYYYGGIYTGIALPLTAQDQDVWMVDLGEAERAEADSWGGHAEGLHAYDQDEGSYDGLTWGRRKKESEDYLLTYGDEGYVPLCGKLWCPSGQSPLGHTTSQLMGFMQAVA